ncbi:hypothetical protein EYV94_05430 [Puteibacter caeruleilacunae]|nr:hypothetical protein EYV94_05430 [Puteibacter caeruleilacunae]
MNRALLFKEYKKTKWFILGIILAGIALHTYTFLKLGRSFRFAGMEHLWDVIINRDQFMFRDLKYFPLAAGVCLGVAQFVPEVIQKRIKLTLHLPLSERKTIMLMVGYGQLLLLGFFLLHILCAVVFSSFHFPYEFILSFLQTVAPWYMAGLLAHSMIAMICIEPTWKVRVFNILVMIGTIKMCYITDFPGAYGIVSCLLAIVVLYVLPFTFYSVYRFKIGEQD